MQIARIIFCLFNIGFLISSCQKIEVGDLFNPPPYPDPEDTIQTPVQQGKLLSRIVNRGRGADDSSPLDFS